MLRKSVRIIGILLLVSSFILGATSVTYAGRPQPTSEIIDLHRDGTDLHFRLHLVNMNQVTSYYVFVYHNDDTADYYYDSAGTSIRVSKDYTSVEIVRPISKWGDLSGHYDVKVRFYNRKGAPVDPIATGTYNYQYLARFTEANSLSGVSIQIYEDANRTVPVDDPLTTNESGQAEKYLLNGTYYYTAGMNGYLDVESSFTISNSLWIESFTMVPFYYVTLQETNNLTEVFIDIYDGGNYIDTIITDVDGEAIIGLVNGIYSYTATKSGYWDYEDEFSVSGANVTETFTMPVPYTVTFNEINDVSGVTIDVYDDEWNYIDYVTTDGNGEATIQLPDGDYYYGAECDGYADIYDGQFTVSGTDMTVDFEMVPYTYTVTFEVVDGNGGAPVSDVGIDVYDSYYSYYIETVYTDSYGEATIQLSNGSYYYDVSSLPEGYHPLDGKVHFDVYNSDSTQYLELWTS
jgi:hypothetical protein